LQSPLSERFPTPDEALAKAKQLQAEARRGEDHRARLSARTSVMIRVAITAAAFEAVVATLPLGSVGFERDLTDKGEKR